MPVIEGTQVCIPQSRKRAAGIIKSMKSLLEARKTLRISRRAFLGQWSKLRKALRLTSDYIELIERVHSRCGGVCELCGSRPMVHVHHLEQVSWNPDLALVDANCQGACKECHDAQH